MAPNQLVTIEDFFSFDYSSLKPSRDYFKYFIHPSVPFISVFVYYFLSKHIFKWIRDTFKLAPKGPLISNLTIIHSFILASYSCWTFFGTLSLVYTFIQSHDGGVYNAICDYSGELWNQFDLDFWVTHFYISKFYEFVDTWIIILKGREPSFLQCFHRKFI
jgi:hypothetical protein